MLRPTLKLRIAHKLALAAGFFAVPVAFILWALVAQEGAVIGFATHEVAGARYLGGLVMV